jgi:integrase
MPRLTQRMIDTTIASASKQVILRDVDLQCFGLRISSKSASYIVECKFQGKTKRVTLGKASVLTLEQARVKAREVLNLMASGVDPDAEKKIQKHAAITLREVLEVYLATKELKPTTIDVYQRQCKNAFASWMDKPVTSITRDMVEDRHREMSNGTRRGGSSGRAYANGCFTTLQALLNFAAEKYTVNGLPLIPVNPVSRLTKARLWHRVHPRTGVVPEYKLRAWYRAVRQLENKTVSDYFLLLLFTGLRRREAAQLKWTDINFEAKTLTIRREESKTHRDHVLPLTEFLLELLVSVRMQ